MSSPIKLSSDLDVSEYSKVVELTQPQAHSGKPFYKINCTCRIELTAVRVLGGGSSLQDAIEIMDSPVKVKQESICEYPIDFVKRESSSGV